MPIAVSSERGFSLLESMVVIGLLATALITLVHLMATSVATAAKARHVTVSTIFAAQKMEQLRTERILDAGADGVESLANTGAVVCDRALRCAAMVYERRWSIASLSSNPDVVFISVSVAHRSGGQRDAHLVSARARVRD